MHSCKKCLHCECRKSNKSGQKFYYCGHPDQKYIQGYFKCHDLEAIDRIYWHCKKRNFS